MLKKIIEYLIIKNSSLFDNNYYRLNHPDVSKEYFDPLVHFICFGWKEGRNPSQKFNTLQYLKNNPDVQMAGVNPLWHYIRHGKKEGRKITTTATGSTFNDFDDLSFSTIRDQYFQHFSTFPPNAADIIIFPILDWDFRFQRPQQLAKQFASLGHRVFYLKAGEHYRENKAPLIKKIEDNLYSVHLIGGEEQVPFEKTLTNNNVKDLEDSINLLIETLLIKSAVIKVDLPFWQKLAIRLKDATGWKLVYDCMDLHAGFSTSNIYRIQDEETLLNNSDAVIASSNYLYNFVKKYHPHPLLVPNAADFEFFHQAVEPKEIEEIKDLSHPIIGYYGAISDWFDTNLIAELASDFPEWTFLLIGDTSLADLCPFANKYNIHLLGEKPYNDIPSYLSNFDVCIIPFKKSPLTEATNPVKLFEYLSAGKPVVSTNLEEISYYAEYTKLAETKSDWVKAIKESLNEYKSQVLLNKRYNFSKENTWSHRAKIILNNIL